MTLEIFDMTTFLPPDMSKLVVHHERSRCSKVYELIDRMSQGRVHLCLESIDGELNLGTLDKITSLKDATVFLINHDWEKLLSGVNPSDEEVKLPSDSCIFEFTFPDACFVYWIENEKHMMFIRKGNPYGWGAIYLSSSAKLNDSNLEGIKKLWREIKATCVALDAEVAYEEVIRAPTFINKKRIKKGKIPLNDYHVVNLSKRHRISNPYGGHSGIKLRLHFRRGHWRHYEEHKTWIKWCLAGDPDLGFVDKHYTM